MLLYTLDIHILFANINTTCFHTFIQTYILLPLHCHNVRLHAYRYIQTDTFILTHTVQFNWKPFHKICFVIVLQHSVTYLRYICCVKCKMMNASPIMISAWQWQSCLLFSRSRIKVEYIDQCINCDIYLNLKMIAKRISYSGSQIVVAGVSGKQFAQHISRNRNRGIAFIFDFFFIIQVKSWNGHNILSDQSNEEWWIELKITPDLFEKYNYYNLKVGQ